MQKQETQEVLEEIKQENVEPVATETVENKGDATEEIPVPVPDEKDQKIEELQNRILRLQADFDNFRRRTTKEQAQFLEKEFNREEILQKYYKNIKFLRQMQYSL